MGEVSDWQTLNYLTNITPQKADLNQGAWARLEDQDVDAMYVATGPLYQRDMGDVTWGEEGVVAGEDGVWEEWGGCFGRGLETQVMRVACGGQAVVNRARRFSCHRTSGFHPSLRWPCRPMRSAC